MGIDERRWKSIQDLMNLDERPSMLIDAHGCSMDAHGCPWMLAGCPSRPHAQGGIKKFHRLNHHMSFVAPVFDMFYKARQVPEVFWRADDFTLFAKGYLSLLGPGDVAVDAGANLGGYTQLMGIAVGSEGEVHSFEPFRLTFQILNANVQLAGLLNVYTYQKALSDTPGLSEHYGSDLSMPGHQTIVNSMVLEHISGEKQTKEGVQGVFEEDPVEPETIESITLDSLRFNRLDLIKIDVEGMEGQVLVGGSGTISAYWPSIIVEIKRYQRRRIHTYLVRSLGYQCYSALTTNPSDFFCVHPRRLERANPAERQRLELAIQVFTTHLGAGYYCLECRGRPKEPVEVEDLEKPLYTLTEEELLDFAREEKVDEIGRKAEADIWRETWADTAKASNLAELWQAGQVQLGAAGAAATSEQKKIQEGRAESAKAQAVKAEKGVTTSERNQDAATRKAMSLLEDQRDAALKIFVGPSPEEHDEDDGKNKNWIDLGPGCCAGKNEDPKGLSAWFSGGLGACQEACVQGYGNNRRAAETSGGGGESEETTGPPGCGQVCEGDLVSSGVLRPVREGAGGAGTRGQRWEARSCKIL